MEIQVKHLWKSYNKKIVLRDLTFQAGNGLTYLTAPSGGGKTTLLRILLGLETADSGWISPGIRWSAVFQEDRLLDGLNAWENLRFVLGPSFDESPASVLLAELGLEGAGEGAVRTWSGGMRRRLALARALLMPADALALDEPFAGLDAENRARALACIQRAASQKPVLLTAHEPPADARFIVL